MSSLEDNLLDIDLNCEETNSHNQSKSSYKERKIDHKLKKYEIMIKNLENISREATATKVEILFY